jgi:hypothetical protein
VNHIRKRFTYANVMSSLAVFLVLGGATAFAATQLAKNSVGPKQLKKNAVTTAKLKKDAVTKAKIKAGAVDAAKLAANSVDGSKIAANAVDGTKIADGSVGGAEINVGSTPFSRVVYEARGNSTVDLASGLTVYPLANGAYEQEAGRTDMYVGALDITFQPSCLPPRSVQAIAMIDAPNPLEPTQESFGAVGIVEDKAGGTVSKRVNMGPFLGLRFKRSNSTGHNITILAQVSCSGGSNGVTATAGAVDVLGVK